MQGEWNSPTQRLRLAEALHGIQYKLAEVSRLHNHKLRVIKRFEDMEVERAGESDLEALLFKYQTLERFLQYGLIATQALPTNVRCLRSRIVKIIYHRDHHRTLRVNREILQREYRQRVRQLRMVCPHHLVVWYFTNNLAWCIDREYRLRIAARKCAICGLRENKPFRKLVPSPQRIIKQVNFSPFDDECEDWRLYKTVQLQFVNEFILSVMKSPHVPKTTVKPVSLIEIVNRATA